mgnify:FL=1
MSSIEGLIEAVTVQLHILVVSHVVVLCLEEEKADGRMQHVSDKEENTKGSIDL